MRILAGYALSCVTTSRREMEYPKLDRKHMVVPVFLVHHLGHNLRVYSEPGLIVLFISDVSSKLSLEGQP